MADESDAREPVTPALALRGTVEGFYGTPWSHADRLAHLEFSAAVGLNVFVYAPKDDPYHRARWRAPYPGEELHRLGELAERARTLGLGFTYAIHPGLSMRYADDAEHATLAAKAGQLFDAGVTSFALLFDDVPYELNDDADRERFGAGPGGCGAAHGQTGTRFVAEVLRPRGIDEPLLICPTDYAGTARSAYRDELSRTAPADALIAWTGSDVVVGQVTREDIDRAAEAFGRRLVLWDNFPVNDFDASRLFLGPLTGRTGDLDGSALVGVISNPMPQAEASRFSLATVAEWSANPGGYEPRAASRRAVELVAGSGAAAFAPLVRACSGWPPSAPEDPQLHRQLADSLAGDQEALSLARARLAELETGARAATTPASLVESVRAWLAGAVDTARAGRAALRLLESDAGASADQRRAARAALDECEEHYYNVLRQTVPVFVRAVLDRTAPTPSEAAIGPRVQVVCGAQPDAADRATVEALERLGFVVADDDPALIVITATASAELASGFAGRAVPIVTWGGATALGMARSQQHVMIQSRITVVDPADPLAARHDGGVDVYKGWAWMVVADVPDQHVVARAGEQGWAALYRYSAGSVLADGTLAAAARIALPLGANGPAPWLLTPAGREVFAAATRLALAGG